MRYFFDTYALIEITNKNPAYVKYADELISTGLLNIMELYYAVLRDFGEQKAKEAYYTFRNCLIAITDDSVFKAMNLRFKLKNKNLSYADCIGHVLAAENSLKFLTGDKEFQHMDNVEFVK